MAAFWAEMGVAYLEINKLPCLHEIDIPKCINVYSIHRTKLGAIGFFVLSFLMFLDVWNSTVLIFYFTCTRGDTEKKPFPLNLYRQIQGLFCVVLYIDDV